MRDLIHEALWWTVCEGGYRTEELAAKSGYPEKDVRKYLADMARRGYVVNKGERGWFHIQG